MARVDRVSANVRALLMKWTPEIVTAAEGFVSRCVYPGFGAGHMPRGGSGVAPVFRCTAAQYQAALGDSAVLLHVRAMVGGLHSRSAKRGSIGNGAGERCSIVSGHCVLGF